MNGNRVNDKMKYLLLFLVTVFSSTPSHANSLADTTSSGILKSGNSTQAAIMVDPAHIAVEDRRNQAGESASKSGTGAGAHAAIGAALVAAAIPMLASIDPFVRAAGAELMAKAALEFAQSGADRGVQNQNHGQDTLLSQQANQGGRQSTDQTNNGTEIHSPELDKLLSDRGINDEDFKNQLTSGQLNNADAVLRALGDNAEISPEDRAKGAALADSEFNKITSPPSIDQSHLAYDEKNPARSAEANADLTAASWTSKDFAAAMEASGSDRKNNSDGSHKGSAGGEAGAAAGADSEKSHTEAGAGGSGLGVLAQLLGLNPDQATEAPGLVRAALERIGILKALPNQTIFQIANRNFRSFGKWRKQVRLAQQ